MRERGNPTATREIISPARPLTGRACRGVWSELPADDYEGAVSTYPSDARSLLGQKMTSKGGLMPQLARKGPKSLTSSGQNARGKSHQPMNSPHRAIWRGWGEFRRGLKGVPFRHLSLE